MTKTRMKKVKNILVLQDHVGTLFQTNGHVQDIEPGALDQLKGKGSTEVIDLSGLTRLTYSSLPEFSTEEVVSVIKLDPTSYLAGQPEVADIALSVIPTLDDQNQTAALSTYMERQTLDELARSMNASGLSFERLSPGLLTAAQPYMEHLTGTLVVHIRNNEYLGLLLEDRHIRSLVRELPRSGSAVQDVMTMLSAMSNVIRDPQRVVMIGPEDVMKDVADQLKENVPNLDVICLSPVQLAQQSWSTPSNLHLMANVRGSGTSTAPWVPLALGVALGLVPYLTLGALNANTQRQLNAVRAQSSALAPQIAEITTLERQIARVQDIQAKADAITTSRVDWSQSLQQVVEQLPEDRGELTVKLVRLQASLPPTPAAPAPVTGTPPTSGSPTVPPAGNPTPLTSGSSTSPTPSNPTPPTPVTAAAPIPTASKQATYRLELQAASRYGATLAISNFERTYVFDMDNLSQAENGTWSIQATATEKQ